MCEFTQREYSCGHFRFIAARWCNLYKITHRRCQPDVTHFEFRQHEICGICQPYEMPPWFHSVKVRSVVTAPATTSPASAASAAASTLTSGCPSSCVRKRRASASKQKASITISSNAGMSPKKAKPSRPPIPLFSSTTALTSHRAA